MDREISFNGDFAVQTQPALRPGGWHIGFLCPQCRRRFAIMDDPTDSGALRFSGAARFHATCPSCEYVGDYATADIAAFQAAQGGPSSTA